MQNDLDVQEIILVELKQSDQVGEQDVALMPKDIPELSQKALENALSAVKGVAERIAEVSRRISTSDRPTTIEIEFGLKLTTDASALIVNVGTESQITVKLKWETNDREKT